MPGSTRIVVLIGAGASVDAGLPLTSQLAENILRNANADRQTPAVQALNFVYGAMVGHQADDGGDPLRAVNIETLVSALRLLQEREKHEVAPFVASWKSGALGFGPRGPSMTEGRALIQALDRELLERHSMGTSAANAVASIARQAIGRGSPQTFLDAERLVLKSLQSELGHPMATAYLQPIVDLASTQAGGLDVVSLNYDLALERQAVAAGVRVDTAMARWSPGLPLDFHQEDGLLRIIKVHGSLDWVLHAHQPYDAAIQSPDIAVRVEGDRELPWIVVGDRDKLATDGPTLRLFQAAFEALSRAEHLVVAGYSFADSHINALIRDWMLVDARHTMTVLDPNWHRADDYNDQSFRTVLVRKYSRTAEPSPPAVGLEARLLPIQGTTATSLHEALSRRPEPDPSPYFDAATTARSDGERTHFELEITNRGRLVTTVSPQVTEPGGGEGRVGLFELETDRDGAVSVGRAPQGQGPRNRTMGTGDTWRLFGVAPVGTEALTLWIHSSDPITGQRSDQIQVRL